MAECGQVDCHELATHRFFWTEGWRLVCEPHAKKAKLVGRALGKEVSIEALVQTDLEKHLSARVKTLEKALKAATDELNNMRVLLQNELNRHADQ